MNLVSQTVHRKYDKADHYGCPKHLIKYFIHLKKLLSIDFSYHRYNTIGCLKACINNLFSWQNKTVGSLPMIP